MVFISGLGCLSTRSSFITEKRLVLNHIFSPCALHYLYVASRLSPPPPIHHPSHPLYYQTMMMGKKRFSRETILWHRLPVWQRQHVDIVNKCLCAITYSNWRKKTLIESDFSMSHDRMKDPSLPEQPRWPSSTYSTLHHLFDKMTRWVFRNSGALQRPHCERNSREIPLVSISLVAATGIRYSRQGRIKHANTTAAMSCQRALSGPVMSQFSGSRNYTIRCW